MTEFIDQFYSFRYDAPYIEWVVPLTGPWGVLSLFVNALKESQLVILLPLLLRRIAYTLLV